MPTTLCGRSRLNFGLYFQQRAIGLTHTLRGTFAGAFKKKLGPNLVSEKVEGGDWVYRIA